VAECNETLDGELLAVPVRVRGAGSECSMTRQDGHASGGAVRLLRGRFEARFVDEEAARTAARDARAVGFVVDVQRDAEGWLAVGRRRLPFPGDERDRYASRLHMIATRNRGAFTRFVEELPDKHTDA
jgi:uncharacterized protein YhdP